MAQTTTISSKELQRLAAAAYEGKTLKVMLCTVGTSGFTAESTVANWQTVEQTGSGYSRFSSVIASGSYSTATGRYEMPQINAAFTATAAFSYDRVILFIDGETNIHSEIQESPNITLAAGQTQTYQLSLVTDD